MIFGSRSIVGLKLVTEAVGGIRPLAEGVVAGAGRLGCVIRVCGDEKDRIDNRRFVAAHDP
jgi:hypothetical protein